MLKEAREMIVDLSSRAGLIALPTTVESLVAYPNRYMGRNVEVLGVGELIGRKVETEKIPLVLKVDSLLMGYPLPLTADAKYVLTLTYLLKGEDVPTAVVRVKKREVYFGTDAEDEVYQMADILHGAVRVKGHFRQDAEYRYIDSGLLVPMTT